VVASGDDQFAAAQLRAVGEKPAEIDALIARKRGEQLAVDQITAKDKEKTTPI
jgi:hypothetical protein